MARSVRMKAPLAGAAVASVGTMVATDAAFHVAGRISDKLHGGVDKVMRVPPEERGQPGKYAEMSPSSPMNRMMTMSSMGGMGGMGMGGMAGGYGYK